MLCQNCGRRASDKLSFCPNCGAVASPDSPGLAMSVMSGPPSPSSSVPSIAVPRTKSARTTQPRSSKQRVTYQQTRSSGGSGFSTIVFLAFVFGMAWWFTKTDDFDLFVFIRQAIESAIDQYQQPAAPPPAQPSPAPPAVTTPAVATPATPATAAGRRSKDAVPAAGDKGTTPALTYRGTTPPDIEGLTQAQVEQRLGAPTRRINGGDGVTVWVYQSQNSATLIVYFYKDRASLKAPR